MKTKILVVLLVCLPVLSFASEGNVVIDTNDVPTYYIERIYPSPNFWGAFSNSIAEFAPDLFESRLHPIRDIKRITRFQGDHERYLDLVDHDVQSAGSRTLIYSFRQAALELPLAQWIRDGDTFFARFLRGSFGNVQEEEIRPNEVSYISTEEHWWRKLSDNGLRYGARPLRDTPYAYISYYIGPKKDPYVLIDARYVFSHFEDHKLEFAVAIPLFPDSSLDLGCSRDLFDRGHGKDRKHAGFTAKYNHHITEDLFVFMGVEVRDHTEMTTGLTISF